MRYRRMTNAARLRANDAMTRLTRIARPLAVGLLAAACLPGATARPTAATATSAIGASAATAGADTLGLDVLRIGLTAAAMPLRSATRDYTEDGLEAALATELGQRFGVPVELVAVPAARQAAALASGDVDVVLARAVDVVDSASDSGRSSPNAGDHAVDGGTIVVAAGGAEGVAVSMRSDTAIRRWQDLAGHRLCVARGNTRAADLAARLAPATLMIVDAPAQALVQVRIGACDAALLEQPQLQALFKRRGWEKFSATLPERASAPLQWRFASERQDLADRLAPALTALATPAAWRSRHDKWAADVAFEVYYDQMSPDCH